MKIFISHGHDELAKLQLKDFIQQTGHIPIVLGQQAGRQGLTIIEAVEKFSAGCEFAVILLTGDDVTSDGGRRARQNVIHEIGFFQGRLSRARVVLIVQLGVELPSNLAGLFYLEYRHEVKEVFADLRDVLDLDRFDGYPEIHAFLEGIVTYKLETHKLLVKARKELGLLDSESVNALIEMDELRGRLYAAYRASRHFLDGEALLEKTERARDRVAQMARQRSRAEDREWLNAHMDEAKLDYTNYLEAFDSFVQAVFEAFQQRADQLRI